jgi:hypothetical protein
MSTVKDAFNIARSMLNDDAMLVWGDMTLMPKFMQAHVEMESKLILNGIFVTHEISVVLPVTTGAKDLGVSQPPDLVIPIRMKEFGAGEAPNQAVPMVWKDFLPDWTLTETLRVWSWREEKIGLIGATTDRQVMLYYNKRLTCPTLVSEPLPVITSETFLGPRIAALACMSTHDMESGQMWAGLAEENLSKIIRAQVKSQQALPSRKLPFSWRARRGRQRYF